MRVRPRPTPHFPSSVPGIEFPRGKLGQVTKANMRPLKEWSSPLGLSRKCVDAMRWKDMVICYNDRTNNTIADLRDDGVVNSSVKEEQQQTKERMREDGCFYDCGDEAAAATPLASPLVRFYSSDGEDYWV